MLIDMHAHTSEISTCCRIPAPQVIQEAKSVGIDGLILTNHYNKPYVTDGDFDAFARRYIAEYEYTKSLGDAIGFPVFFGIEIAMEKYNRLHMLVYGVEPSFLQNHPMIFDATQKGLYQLVKAYGGAMIQAHPMRGGKNVLLDPQYLDGVEINSHPLYDGTHIAELEDFAHQHGLILTSGGDYHADTHRPCCGALLPDNIHSNDIGRFLCSADSIELCYQEPKDSVKRAKRYDRLPLAERILRVQHMEEIFNSISKAINQTVTEAHRQKLRDALRKLEAYYTGGDWLSDYDADHARLFPTSLRRGVLSQDAIYDLLAACQDL